MMESGFPASSSMHRRYLISSGDSMSFKHLRGFEDEMRRGTHDLHVVRRARRVHQSLLTTPFSAAVSFLQIFPLLMTAPGERSKLGYPDVIFTNGPGTGFFVALAAHLLKILCIVPKDSMRVLYVESWARIHTLSLTGKLFHMTGIADVFLVQHPQVSKKYNVTNAGWLVVGPR